MSRTPDGTDLIAVVNPDGTGLGSSGGQYVQLKNKLMSSTLSRYLREASDAPKVLQVMYEDDFSNGFQGWQYQHDSSSIPKNGLTLSQEARQGNYSLELHSSAVNSGACWARKGYRIAETPKKLIFGCVFSIHSENVNKLGSVSFDFDTQIAVSGSERWYFSIRYLNYSTSGGGLLQKWQMQTGTATAQSFTDVTGGAMPICYNEPYKPMPSFMLCVVDFETKKYDKLYCNNLYFNLASQNVGPTASTSLSNFERGLVNIVKIENRSDSATEGIMFMECPFMAWGY